MPQRETGDPSTSKDNLLSRRDFTVMSVAAGIAGGAGTANASVPIAERSVAIETPDGTCDAVLVHPQGKGRVPAVILYPDALGLRPVKVAMARRLAGEGYAALVVNQFYRVRMAPVFPPDFNLSDPDDRAKVMKMIQDLDHARVMRDAAAHVAFLDRQPEVNAGAKIGAVGFCMGGSMAVRTAAAVPDRVGAAVSFHGGRLVTDEPESPHRLIPATRAAYHIGISVDDDEKEPDAKSELKHALDTAGRPGTVEVYAGTKHGWTVPDAAAYNAPQAERAWAAMVALYKQRLV